MKKSTKIIRLSVTLLLLIAMLLTPMSPVFAVVIENGDADLTAADINSNSKQSDKISTSIDDEVVAKIDYQNINIVKPKVEFANSFESIRLELSESLKYELQLNVVDSFDYIVASFISTQGVALDSYKSITMEYSESVAPICLSFNPNNYSLRYGIELNYCDLEFEKIFVIIDVIDENKIVQTKNVTISAFFTNHGVFLSRYGNIFAYDKYISYLFENNLITNEDVKNAHKKMTEIQAIAEEPESTYPSLEISEPTKLITYFDLDTQSISSISANEYVFISQRRLNGINNISKTSLMATSTSGPINSPLIRITRTINALSNGDELRVYGYVHWTDIDGTLHPARNIEVKIMDEDTTVDDNRNTVYTNNSGYYTATIDNQNDAFENGCDIYIRVNFSNSDFEVISGLISSIFSEGYYVTTAVTDNVTASQPMVEYEYEGEEYYRALSIHQAMVVGYYYYNEMNNGNSYFVAVKYPHDGGSESNTITDFINISEDDYCDWDVIIHELGHQVATVINADAFFISSHLGGENLMERYGKSYGIKGAWNEGWATYFSLASQKYYNSYVAIISNITNVADDLYVDLAFNSGAYYQYVYRDYSTYEGCGEGNEAAVTYVLLYLVYRAGLTHQELWNIAKASACNCFSDFMETLYNSVDKSFYTQIGILLEEQNVADEPDVRTSIFSRNTPGTFYWNPIDTTDGAIGNYQYDNNTVITFFDEDYDIVMESSVYASDIGSNGVSINSDLWELLDSKITGASFYWCVATFQNDNPSTGPYYSTFHKAYFLENITTIENTNVQYSGYLHAYDDIIYKFVAPVAGDYTFFSTGETDVNVTIYSDTKLEGSNITDDDTGDGLNFLYNRYLASGTTIYLKVGGYRNTSGDFNIAAIRYNDMSLYTIRNMTVYGTDGIWFRFVVPSSGNYNFYTTGEIDVYGELFNYPVQNGSIEGRLAYNDDDGEGHNFLITYDLLQGSTIYVRVRGFSSSISGTCSLNVVKNVEA